MNDMDLPLQLVVMFLTSINIWFHGSLIPQKNHSKPFWPLLPLCNMNVIIELLYFIYRDRCINNCTRFSWLCTPTSTWAGRGVCWPIRSPTCWGRSPGTPPCFTSLEPNYVTPKERRRMFYTVFHFLNFGLLLGIIQWFLLHFLLLNILVIPAPRP